MDALDRYLSVLPPVALAVTIVGAAVLLVALGWCVAAARENRQLDAYDDLVAYSAWATRAACTDAVSRERVVSRLGCYSTSPWHRRMTAAAVDDLTDLVDVVDEVEGGRHRARRTGRWSR
ncbi:hypothetical protein J4H86_21285 [Spiractinospora alimapuensis]|uniref:hypothetical protein n=1 Tax=Spiractinospora alimapuensis TaxID=2820884 RepID=UPI001F33BF1C|nr:hypothetical protein [Spiractinospora alimapuensis]QVQ51325.1 hypothetical protein J4H86_21285 [Spiractinospora alimapuensis]